MVGELVRSGFTLAMVRNLLEAGLKPDDAVVIRPGGAGVDAVAADGVVTNLVTLRRAPRDRSRRRWPTPGQVELFPREGVDPRELPVSRGGSELITPDQGAAESL